ncbi:MAG TPA: 4-(cytidine 5'-diphospho)-2-C-methyl-D-erythritol kinase [Bacteroidales bacterium]|jgi:4-diphosphocytidyl-2-C-methyl-D-erythritol kinase|nr:4-(cytidine 5'-diphospho)-2-C-methyl-D-erythritol kinase [Bacteroidales bacterium]HOS71049.1 4-(cytidine 5'-diphospho)-2-C-methyl-D-erythritol kinase [Bacteroidales bacterium]HQH24175.1 4-(cytidine 5'-diphospho)-2-C-methyl-D-erythritol kinase [Bacteroidales bacterium]HQJ81799.1 4-(cytidine 5'-diphospho)-2-C-methyl-D-erythritol kinase [Bacteroidales bacterium]
MITFPAAKINIGLRVISRRHDGFHDIETVFYPVGLRDALEFVVHTCSTGEDEMVVTGLGTGSAPGENLVITALKKMRESYNIPALKIHLHKKIPAAAGLGGGSSDAAFFLKAVNKCFSLGIDNETLRRTALEIGSDCPFFVDPVPSYATGRGEILRPAASLPPGFRIILAYPGIRISTRDAYNNCIPAKPSISLEEIVKQHPSQWKNLVINDFEQYVFRIHPEIRELKEAFYRAGAVYSSLSGSGSAVYAIFRDSIEIPGHIKPWIIYEGDL